MIADAASETMESIETLMSYPSSQRGAVAYGAGMVSAVLIRIAKEKFQQNADKQACADVAGLEKKS
jgi:hypothetical protein